MSKTNSEVTGERIPARGKWVYVANLSFGWGIRQYPDRFEVITSTGFNGTYPTLEQAKESFKLNHS